MVGFRVQAWEFRFRVWVSDIMLELKGHALV